MSTPILHCTNSPSFVPGFDREVDGQQVLRYGQESIFSLCGMNGFGTAPTHNDVCRRQGEVATDPVREIVQYLKRGIANAALGNKDNHARNTVIEQGRLHNRLDTAIRLRAGVIARGWIALRIRWRQNDGGSPIWTSAIAQACQAAQLDQRRYALPSKSWLRLCRYCSMTHGSWVWTPFF